jgi:hypothetical protein
MSTNKASKKLFDLDQRVKPGWYLYLDKLGKFTILETDPKDHSPLIIPAKHLETQEVTSFTISQISKMSREDSIPPIFAPTLEALDKEITLFTPSPIKAPESSVSPELLSVADLYLERNLAVEAEILEIARKCKLSGKKFNATKAINQACDKVNHSGKFTKWLTRSAYYRTRKLLTRYSYDRTAIASHFGRSTKDKYKKTKAMLLFVDSVILEHSANRGNTELNDTLYNLLVDHHKRTKGLWVDPDKCVGGTPEVLVAELLNVDIPMENILANSESNKLLVEIQLPSRSWFYNYLNWYRSDPNLSEQEIIKRYGIDFYEKKIMVFDTYVKKASLPLEYVFADHCLLDIFIVDENDITHIYRVWFSVLLCAKTRYVLGMSLLEESPCIESIQSLLMNGVYPKDELLEDLELEYPEGKGWEFCGIPQNLSLDNAWAHHSLSLEALCRNVSLKGKYNSIKLLFRPPYKGRYGGLIERLFGNLQGKVKKLLPGGFESSEPNVVRNAAKEACLYFTDLKRELVKLIVKYNHTPHSELGGMTPHEKWQECMENTWHPPYPRNKAVERLFWRSDPNTRKINPRGISAFGMHYWSPDLEIAMRVNKDGTKVGYGFSYEPSDISRLAIFRDGEFVCDVFAKELRLPDDTYQHVSLAERKLAKKLAKSHHQNSQDWLQYMNEVKQLKELRMAEQKGKGGATGKGGRGKKGKGDSSDHADSVGAGAGPSPKGLPPIPTSKSDAEKTRLLANFATR